jgi:hypothetical protein
VLYEARAEGGEMDNLIVSRPSVEEYINRVDGLAQKYGKPWLALYPGNESMSGEDQADLEFLCTAFWAELMDREFKSLDSEPPNDDEVQASTSEEPGIPRVLLV